MKAWQDLVGGESLTRAEVALIEACLAGQSCTLGEDRPDKPSEDREIRASILKALITGGLPDQPTTNFGVHLEGAYISDKLDLSFFRAKGRTGLVKGRFEYGLEAMQAQFEFLNLSGSYLPELNAQGARVVGEVFLRGGFHANGTVSLSGAEIGGQLECTGGRFENRTGHALLAQGARVKGDVFLRDGFHATGEVSLSGADIGGQLSCDGGQFENPNGDALNAECVQVKGHVLLSNKFYARGEVRLLGAEIGGQLFCEGGKFKNSKGDALNAQGAQVRDGLFFRKVT